MSIHTEAKVTGPPLGLGRIIGTGLNVGTVTRWTPTSNGQGSLIVEWTDHSLTCTAIPHALYKVRKGEWRVY